MGDTHRVAALEYIKLVCFYFESFSLMVKRERVGEISLFPFLVTIPFLLPIHAQELIDKV